MLSPARAIRILPLSLQLVAMIPSLGQASPGQLDYSFAGIKSAQVGANVMCHALAPEVLDFGLVKALSIGMDSRPGLTRQNAVQGTPAFIAPEQR